MKIQVKYMLATENGSIHQGRTAWIGKDSNGQLTISTIYTTEETANDTLTVDDYKEILRTGTLKVINIVMTNRVLLADVKVGDKLFVAKPAYPAIKHVEILDIGEDDFYNNINKYATSIGENGIGNFETRSSLMDDGIIPNNYNRSMAFRTYEEALFYMEWIGFPDTDMENSAISTL